MYENFVVHQTKMYLQFGPAKESYNSIVLLVLNEFNYLIALQQVSESFDHIWCSTYHLPEVSNHSLIMCFYYYSKFFL